MDERTVLIASFGVGVLLQSLLLLRARISFGPFLGCLGLAVLGMIPGKGEHLYEPLRHVLSCYLIFAVAFGAIFKRQLLPSLSDRAVLTFTAIFWFAYLSLVYRGTRLDFVLITLLAIPTLGLVVLTLGAGRPGSHWRIASYAWFLTLVTALSVMQYSTNGLQMFDAKRELPWWTPLDSGLAGMACGALVINVTFFAMLWPIPRRGQSWADRKIEWLRYLALLDERFSNDRSPHLFTIMLIGLVTAALILVHRTHWMSPTMTIHLAIVLAMFAQSDAQRTGNRSAVGASMSASSSSIDSPPPA